MAGIAALVIGGIAWSALNPAFITLRAPENAEMEPVVFGHWRHQQSYACYTCHPRIFSDKKRELFDHEAMADGRYCGACHDGKVASESDDEESTCDACHLE